MISPHFRTLANPASRVEEEHLAVSLSSALSGAARFRHEGLALIVRRATIALEQGRCGRRSVRKDHYAILGVTPASEDVVIRAAYHALMRRYHPDADPSQEAAERSRAVNEAYAVLRDPERRARYDETLSSRDLMFDPAEHPAPAVPLRSRLGPATAIAFALLAVAMITFAIAPPVADLPALKAG